MTINYLMQHKAFFVLFIMWSLAWKGVALWKAGNKKDKIWFIILLLINTFGILDIAYYYFIGDRKKHAHKKAESND